MKFKFAAIFIFAFYTCFHAQSPGKQSKQDSYFGIQVKPLIPTNFIGTKTLNIQNDGLFAEFNQQIGYSFGATVRVGLTKLISLETGINFVQRKYNYTFTVPDSSLVAKNDFKVISYDIPIAALFYIQLTDKFYMNASMGGAIVFNPTNVKTKVVLPGLHQFVQEGRKYSSLAFEATANIGFEYRTEKSGIFYLGASGRVPVKPIFTVAAIYDKGGTQKVAIGRINGSYISLDLRYFFPNIKNKGTQFTQGPIIQ